MTHSPGPWKAGEWNHHRNGVPIDGPGCWVALAFYMGGTEQAKENASLIAAAPDMLELLRRIHSSTAWFSLYDDEKNTLEAILAKVDGRTPALTQLKPTDS